MRLQGRGSKERRDPKRRWGGSDVGLGGTHSSSRLKSVGTWGIKALYEKLGDGHGCYKTLLVCCSMSRAWSLLASCACCYQAFGSQMWPGMSGYCCGHFQMSESRSPLKRDSQFCSFKRQEGIPALFLGGRDMLC
eukprot:jgi/Botrbrau1/23008/Bobra.0622s0001.1